MTVLPGAERLGLEGVVSKRRDSRYRSGRTERWRKIKCWTTSELIVVGTALDKRSGAPIALLAEEASDGLRFAGGAFITLRGRERRKNDQSEQDADFRSRHWLGEARQGAALPDLSFSPEGERIELTATSTYLRFARLTFTESATASVPTLVVQGALSAFVDKVLSKLSSSPGGWDTDAHEPWRLVKQSGPEEELYCRLVGSLGLSPYEPHATIDEILERLSRSLDQRVLVDLCQASSASAFERISELGEDVYRALPHAPEVDLAPLIAVDVTLDEAGQAWRWGKAAATQVRTHFGISAANPEGGASFFERLSIDASGLPGVVAGNEADGGQIAGGLEREAAGARIALVESPEPQRRFAAARSTFLAWTAKQGSSRLVTGARTREQQASRSFAAEMLAPIAYIRRQGAGAGTAISSSRLDKIANELRVSPWVVRYQALNDRLMVLDY